METTRISELLTERFVLARGEVEKEISGISTDSRSIKMGEMFVALNGDRFDGHDFLEEAVKRGAIAVVVRNDYDVAEWLLRHENITIIRIFDTLFGLGELARRYREKFPIPVIGITGSNGKTSTKDLIAEVMGRKYKTVKTLGNLNNLVGVPLTLMRLGYSTEAAVIELGMNQIGEIARLTEIVSPEVGVITNISETHLEHLKSVDNVAKGKRELPENMGDDTTLLLNADDPYRDKLCEGFGGKVLTFGIESENADFRALNPRLQGKTTVFEFEGQPVYLNVPGYHFVYNALAALALGKLYGIPDNEIRGALASTKLTSMRMELMAIAGKFIINDSYNANPRSVREAIRTFSDLSLEGRRILILGDMLELGVHCVDLHLETGRVIDSSRIDYLITFGPMARFIADGAVETGFPPDHVFAFEDRNRCRDFISGFLVEGDNVLLKGSRGMKMEELIQREGAS